MSRHERVFLKEMPVKDKGERAREDKENLQMTVKICPL